MPEKKKRTSIPKVAKVKAELQSEINSVCPFCKSTEVGHFEIHHIDENPTNNGTENLILICPNCHSKVTKGDISQIEVLKKKILSVNRKNSNGKEKSSVNFNDKVGNAVVGDNNRISIKNSPKKQKAKYPEGCIGFDTVKANYIAHLIKRYNEYKEYEVGKGNVRYAVFGAHLKKRYKIGPTRTIYNVPIGKFEELSQYIQLRIDGTKLAKIKGNSHKNYSDFTDYEKDYG